MPIVGVVEKELVWVIIIVVLVAIGGGASNKNEPTKVGENSGLLVPMQSALNAWNTSTFADCFFIYAYLCYLKISDVKT